MQPKKRKSNVQATTKKEKDPTDEEDGDEGNGDEPEEEYEIEAILEAKHGTFPEGRIGYLVKWKGYGEEHNSWVDEQDATNAVTLIDDYWQRDKKKKNERKSTAATTKASATKPRKSSAVRDESSEVEPPPKKRGRPSNASKAAKSEPDEDEDAKPAPPPKKKAKPGRKSSAKTEDAMEVDEAEEFRDVKKYRNMPSWEHLVDTVDTVERGADGKLIVYFTLKGKGRAKEESTICKQKMPNKLLDFYEQNLRWKPVTDEEAED
ncbi:hypothetical protein B0H21DRAFT_695104 [Amylocystis lapponica]|nr:hypothetical protein B0H21DRAFT_695104 [Amylocystis lapponica]